MIGLAESENEARGGVRIDIGPSSGKGYRLEAKHVLDSNFATGVGVFAALDAEEKGGASAGLKSENANTNLWAKFKEKIGTNVPDLIFTKLTKGYADNQAKANAGATNNLSVAGALAFIFSDHDVVTEIGGTAVLKSNEDLEVKATIAQKLTLDAESNAEPQENADGSREQRRHDGQRRRLQWRSSTTSPRPRCTGTRRSTGCAQPG